MQRFKRSLLLAILLLTGMAAPRLWALQTEFRGGPVTIEADSIAYDGEADAFHAVGSVLITFEGGYLKADYATLNRATNIAVAEGGVFVRSGQDVLEGERVLFNVVAKTGTIDDGKMFLARNHFYVRGERIEKKGEATYRLENAAVTTCDGETPDWRLEGRELELTVDGYGTLRHGRFLARDIPILYLPYLLFPAKTTRQSGFLFPRFSFSRDKNGLDVELPFYWAVSESADATFFQRYMEKRGFKEGLEFRYAPSAETFGTFYADFIRDRKRIAETAGVLSRDWQEDRNRWSFYLNHETTFAPGLMLRSDIRRVSDRWYFRDFSSFNYYLDHYSQSSEERFRRVSFLGNESLGSLDSTVRLVKDWDLFNLTALARYTDDFSSVNNDATLQKAPELILTGFRRPLFETPLQMEFNAGYDHFYRREGQKGHLWEVNPVLFYPMNLGSYLRITSNAGFRGSFWERTDSLRDGGDRFGDRELFQFGTAMSTEMERVYNVGESGLQKIRHGIKPEIVYTYITGPSASLLPDFLEQLPGHHGVAFALTNTLLARIREEDGKIRYREIMRFRLAQNLDIREARRETAGPGPEKRPLGDVDLELDVAPFSYVSLSARNRYSVNSGDWIQRNYDLTLSDARGDSASAGYRYTRETFEEFNLSLKAAVTPALDAVYILRRSEMEKRTIESTYGIRYRKQCWNVELSVSDRQDDRTVMVLFSLYGLGKVGVQ